MTRPHTDNALRLTLVAIHPGRSPQSVPLAAAFLAAAVRARFGAGVTVTILDLYADQTPDECSVAIRATRPDLAGFSVYLWNRALCCAVAGMLKEADPRLTLCCGGPEATADQERLLTEAPWDFLIRGDGEGPLVAALEALRAGGAVALLPGIATRAAGRLTAQPPAGAAVLDELPSPLLSGALDAGRYAGMLWQISRGCSFGCEFCFDGGGSRTVRRFSLERLEAELRWFVSHGVSQVFVLDSTFNSDRQRAVSVLRLIRRIAPQIHFHFEVRSEFLDREQAKLFATITCSLQIGLQSGSRGVLQEVGRSFDRADFTTKVSLLNEAGAIFGFDLIYGLPGDSLAGFRESLDFALALYPNHLDIFPLALLPGTVLARRAATLGLEHLPAPPYTLLAAPTFPVAAMAEAGRLAEACDIFYSRGKAVAWFMSVAAAVKLAPSDLLAAFAAYLDARKVERRGVAELDDAAIFPLQTGFVRELFPARGAKKLLPLALDLITYNHHYAAALMTVAPPPLAKQRLAKLAVAPLKPRLAASARLAAFSYDLLEVLAVESGDLRQMAQQLSRAACWAVIYPSSGVVRCETLHPAYVRLLERLDGTVSVAAAARELALPEADAVAFVRFALGEGIVTVNA